MSHQSVIEKIIRLNTDSHGRVDPAVLDRLADAMIRSAERTADAEEAGQLLDAAYAHRAAAFQVRHNSPRRTRRMVR